MNLQLVTHMALALFETALLAVLLWGTWRLADRARARLQAGGDDEDIPASAGPGGWIPYLRTLLSRMVQLAAVFVSAGLLFAWLTSVLLTFPATQQLGHELGAVFDGALSTVGNGLVKSIPGLIVVVVIFVLAQAAVEASNATFRAIARRQLQIVSVHPETASATRRLVALGIWALAVVAAYPYLPGSQSDVFKGVSVLLGAMVTLGSSGVVTQLMSGLVLVYSRALRVGDHVVIGSGADALEGEVQQVGSLATKLVNIRNEEITIPNAVLVNNAIKNYSRLSERQGTMFSTHVTIGYDAPWRQVHAMLLDAAARTSGLRGDPAPYVLQRGLNDFYVDYELFVYLDRPLDRMPTLSRLHENIQDCFNEAGVQIMSPHFMAQPQQPVLAPR